METIAHIKNRDEYIKQMQKNIASKEQKEKETEEIKKEEEIYKKNQLKNYLTVVPLMLSLSAIHEITRKAEKQELYDRTKGISDENDHEINKVIFASDPDRVINLRNIEILTSKSTNKKYKIYNDNKIVNKNVEILEIQQDHIPIKEVDDLTTYEKKTIMGLKERRLIEEYGKELKDIRLQLRETIFEYNVIVNEKDEAYSKKEVDNLIGKLNYVIKKIEELKDATSIINYEKYDNNYLYVLIEDYLKEFNNKRPIEELKSSPLYIEIANKLQELEKKKDSLAKDLDNKKEQAEIDEDTFDELKEKYYNFDKINDTLSYFQKEQEKIMQDFNDKIDKAVSIEERTRLEIVGINRLTRGLLTGMGVAAAIPGVRSARSMAARTATSLMLMRRFVRPRIQTRTYRQFVVKDYSREIEKNLSSIYSNQSLLQKANKQINNIIKDFKLQYKEYFGKIHECDEILSNLESVQDSLKEKEYELERIKDMQEKALERNNAKVKAINASRYI